MALPGMLGNIVGDIVRAQPDMELVAAVDDVGAVSEAVGRTDAGFALVGDIADRECTSILRAHPRTKVVSVVADGRRGFLVELRPHRVPLGEVSPQGLIDALRSAAVEAA
jgi:hypothetical protein